jgi:hypothetical protein
MAADLQQVIEAAARAALDDAGQGGRGAARNGRPSSKRHRRRRLSGAAGFLVGAGLVTAGRLVVGSRGREWLEGLQERLLDYEERHFGDTLDHPDELEDETPDQPEDEPE